jgi:adenylyl-sulfate kinase
VVRADREKLLGQKGHTVWLTGLSGSGKSTIAYEIERRLTAAGRLCAVLDGDNVRHGLNRDLGFSADDRTENIRRIAEVARLMNGTGIIVITSFISPYARDREDARGIIGPAHFLEAHVDAPLEVCEKRDPKGLYRKVRAGEIPQFTGITDPYQAPAAPDLRLTTETASAADCADAVIARLEEDGILKADRS